MKVRIMFSPNLDLTKLAIQIRASSASRGQIPCTC